MDLRSRCVRGPVLALANLLGSLLWVGCDDTAIPSRPDARGEVEEDAAVTAEPQEGSADSEEADIDPDRGDAEPRAAAGDASQAGDDAEQDAAAGQSADGGSHVNPDAASPQHDAGPVDIVLDASHVMDASDAALGADADPLTIADAGAPDAGADSDGHVAEAGCACAAPTAVCLAGTCVECTAGNKTACAAYELCDEVSHTCVDNAPFQLDCANLPSDGACQGGPREVILGMHRTGLVAMFDPVDGHFLGWFSRRSIVPYYYSADFYLATQGPDQCIWTVRDNANIDNDEFTTTDITSIDRLDSDGSFKDSIIPLGRHLASDPSGGVDDIINSVRSIAFTKDSVYVASTRGDPYPRVSRFTLAGELDEVVLDDGSVVDSLLVLRDGSMVIGNRNGGVVEQLTPDLSERRVVAAPVRPGQLAYAGQGTILTVSTSDGGRAYRTELATGQSQEILPWRYHRSSDNAVFSGISPLANGQWLVSLWPFGVRALDPSSSAPPGQHTQLVPADPSTDDIYDFRRFGRACLPTAFVESRHPSADPPLTNCAAPAGAPLFKADFETGFDGFVAHYGAAADRATIFSMTRESTGPNNTALKVVGGWRSQSDFLVTARKPLPDLKPSFIEYSVRALRSDFYAAAVTLNELNRQLLATGIASGAVMDGHVVGEDWVRLQLRDIDWVNRTYDLYLTRPGNDADCTRLSNDALFGREEDAPLKLLDFGNGWETSVGWIDDIVIK